MLKLDHRFFLLPRLRCAVIGSVGGESVFAYAKTGSFSVRAERTPPMAQINVTNLTFGYDGSFDYIFENVSFSVDTDWKLGFIGRNGKGKTTFLNLLLGKYEYTGNISTNVVFDYFPYRVASEDLGKPQMILWTYGNPASRAGASCANFRSFRWIRRSCTGRFIRSVSVNAPRLCWRCCFECRDFSLKYKNGAGYVFENLTFEVAQGERVFISGENGSGKSSLINAILEKVSHAGHDYAGRNHTEQSEFVTSGELNVAAGLIISYINQDTSHLKGSLRTHAVRNGLDYTLFLSLLRQLDMERVQFDKNMEEYSDGQKKKVLIASSLLTPAHLYIWDEPLNYIDVFSRIQIEALIERYKPTMLIVEHDVRFREKLAMKEVRL